jgi:hypothetical protein
MVYNKFGHLDVIWQVLQDTCRVSVALVDELARELIEKLAGPCQMTGRHPHTIASTCCSTQVPLLSVSSHQQAIVWQLLPLLELLQPLPLTPPGQRNPAAPAGSRRQQSVSPKPATEAIQVHNSQPGVAWPRQSSRLQVG